MPSRWPIRALLSGPDQVHFHGPKWAGPLCDAYQNSALPEQRRKKKDEKFCKVPNNYHRWTLPGRSYTNTNTTMLLPWIHPHLAQSANPNKGRQLQASQRIQRGEVLLVDPPYAIIPISGVDTTGPLLCSNPQCNSPVQQTTGTRCPNRCNTDVIWCNDTCRDADNPRHTFECTWLSKYAASLRSKWGEYNFGMLWLIVRTLSRRHAEQQKQLQHHSNDDNNDNHLQLPPDSPLSYFKSGWPAIDSLCGTIETWSHAQVREWTVLVKKYLSSSSLPHTISNTDALALICKEEANSFGLYPRETGVFPPPSPAVDRGEQFGAAVYPRASIANHSCCPNVRLTYPSYHPYP